MAVIGLSDAFVKIMMYLNPGQFYFLSAICFVISLRFLVGSNNPVWVVATNILVLLLSLGVLLGFF